MWFLTPCLSCFLFLICSLILSQFWGTRFKGVVCSQNPCVFLSSVYVVLNVVYLRGFCSCIKHKHQWHVNHVAYRAECIPFICPDRPHPHYCLQDIKRDFRFMSHLFWRFKPCLWFFSVISHLFESRRLEMVMIDTTDRRFLPLSAVHRCTEQ